MIASRLLLLALLATGLIAAGCGGDDEEDESGDETTALTVLGAEEAAGLQEEIAGLSDEEQVKRVGEAWADPFAAEDTTMCGYLHPDLGGASSCNDYVTSSLTQSSKVQASFADTTVETVQVKGERALAEFSNGHQVAFLQDPEGAWKVVDTPRAKFSGASKVIQPTLDAP